MKKIIILSILVLLSSCSHQENQNNTNTGSTESHPPIMILSGGTQDIDASMNTYPSASHNSRN